MSTPTHGIVWLRPEDCFDPHRRAVPTWRCRHCEWEGASPSISDASEVRNDGTIDRTHVAICPMCFRTVRRIR